jgi:ParB-like chromosome segregation protein Spo0J
VLVDTHYRIIAGHGRVEAAKRLGRDHVPAITLEHLSEEQLQAFALADNRLAEGAGWDNEVLALELQHLREIDLDFDLEITGFETAEIDRLINSLAGDGDGANEPDPRDDPDDSNDPGDADSSGDADGAHDTKNEPPKDDGEAPDLTQSREPGRWAVTRIFAEMQWLPEESGD